MSFQEARPAGRSPSPELGEEPDVVIVKHPDILYTILDHCDTLHPHPEGVACTGIRIVSDLAEDLRINHAGAGNLDPAAVLANPAAAPSANVAGEIVLHTGLGERKEMRTERLAKATEGMGESTKQMADATAKMQQNMGKMAEALNPLVGAEETVEKIMEPERRLKKKLEHVSGRLEKIKQEIEQAFSRNPAQKP